MKHLADYILQKIQKNMRSASEKLVIRVDGFEDLRLYLRICEELDKICSANGQILVAKLSRNKFIQLDETGLWPNEASLMRQRGWVDEEDHMTSYRNQLPEDGKRLVVLLLGTDMVDDKGGLNDFFAITPNQLDEEIGNRYDKLIGPELQEAFDNPNLLCEVVNRFFNDLFSCVPKNLAKVSTILDEWLAEQYTIQEVIVDLFGRLPEWGIPVVHDAVGHLSPTKFINTKEKNSLVRKASDFIRGKTYSRVTQSTITKIRKLFQQYREGNDNTDPGKYAQDYPLGQAIQSLSELEDAVISFVIGDRSAELINRLINTDFSIVQDVLKGKTGGTPVKLTPTKVTGSPLVMLIKVFLSLLQKYHNDMDELRIYWQQVRLCGIPSNVEVADQDERDALMLEAWSSVTRFAGGINAFINEENWQGTAEQPVKLKMEPESFFQPTYGATLISDGIVTSGSGTTHKVSFRVEGHKGDEIIHHEEFSWVIDPNEDWMLAFRSFTDMPEDETCYLPYGVISDINTAYSLKDEESFAHWITHAKVQLDDGSLWTRLDRELIDAQEEDEVAKFYKLGQCFQRFRHQVMNQGFFASLNDTASAFLSEYITFAEHICKSQIYTSKLHSLVGRIAFFFTMCETTDPVLGLCAAQQVIVPPWHPATLEKLADQMLFIRSGMYEWSQIYLTENYSPERRLDEIMSLSTIRTATDSFFRSGSEQMISSRSFGYYTLYGDIIDTEAFTSAQQIERKEAVFDDDFDDRDMQRLTREGEVLLRVIRRYVDTYPQAKRSLSIAFINPEDLQSIVSALYQYVVDLRKDDPTCQVALKLTVINRSNVQGARAYLAYWINHVFTLDDNLDVKAYLQVYGRENEIPKLIPQTTDLAFFFDALNTNKNASYHFRRCRSAERLSDCRFPMVFRPALKTKYGLQHSIDITQPQFRAATAHTQLLRVYNDAQQYDYKSALVQTSEADRKRGEVIRQVQERVVWLCCIDNAMDKYTVRELYAEETGIIGFTTGEGSYGQMNLALTCRSGVVSDLRQRCKRRLHIMFPSWSDSQLNNAAEYCLKKAGELDGASILRAMNPNDFDMNNFLAYLIADELTEKKKNCLCILIRLDSYRHWFHDAKKTETKIPDFLLLQSSIVPGGTLKINATVIEAKIAGGISMLTEHLPHAKEQVAQGISVLSRHFDPDSHSVERRYWLAQLYRAIAFLQADAEFDDAYFRELTDQLNEMVEGNYAITWDGRILGCEIDGNFSIIQESADNGDVSYDYWRIGQLGIQNLLQGKALDAEASYDGNATIEEVVINDAEDSESAEELVDDTTVVADESVAAREVPSISPTHPVPENISEDRIETSMSDSHQTTQIGNPVNNTSDGQTALTDVQSPSSSDIPGSITPSSTALEQIRVLIGQDRGKRPVYWEYGNPQLANRHLLITGGSGQGKTYAIQTFLYELARQGISSVVFDYTDGFLPGKLEPPFEQELAGRIEQHYAIAGHLPINPFKRQPLRIPGLPEGMLEHSTNVASRFSAIMKHVYSFGEQQAASLYQACKEGIDHFGDQMDFDKLRQLLSAQQSTYSKTVLSKMQQLFDLDLFDTAGAFDWSRITERDGKVTVIQLTSLDREIQTVITEMLMWDAWYSLVKFGDKSRPFVVVLDEAQNLSIADGSPAQKILQEGRKYGWSAWFATQFMKGALSSDEISRLQQAAEILYFKPSPEETSSVASMLSDGNTSAAEWAETLKQMQKGHCIVRGDRIRANNTFGAAPAALVKVSSFEERT